MKSILVVGSINNDISVDLPYFPQIGETMYANNIKKFAGGKGLNQAVASARQGQLVSFVGCVGNDAFGKEIIGVLEEEKINVKGIKTSKDKNSGTAIVLVDSSANNMIMLEEGANKDITEQDIDESIEIIKSADYCIMQCEIPISVIKYTAKLCKENNILVVFNPAPYSKDIDEELLSLVDYLIPNEVELNQLVGDKRQNESILSKCNYLHSIGASNIIVTLGEKGSLYSIKKGSQLETGTIKACKVKTVDTTGAGDTFIGSFVSELKNKGSVIKAIEYATMAASISVTKKGAMASIPTRKEVEKLGGYKNEYI